MGERKYFGTDGIRGRANTHPMTAEVALRVGLAAGRLFRTDDDRRHLVVIGKDTRLSGYMIEPALVAGLVWVMIVNGVAGGDIRGLACALTIFAGITMVSNIRYYSFKDINLRKSVPFFVVAAIALAFALMMVKPEITLFGFFVLYALSGYVMALFRLARRKNTAAQ